MLRKNDKQLVWYEFELLQSAPLKHAVFTKRGGMSFANCDESLVGNIERIQGSFGVKKMMFVNQVHGKDVELVHASASVLTADGMVTKNNDVALAIKHADCQAAIFYDQKNHLIANVHSGWRGNVQNIYKRTVEKMKKEGNTNPQDLIVCISPSLGPKAAQFTNFKKDFPKHFWKYKDENDCFNLWEIARDQLLELSIPADQIEIASKCTYENKEDFFSYRRGKDLGRNATVCALK